MRYNVQEVFGRFIDLCTGDKMSSLFKYEIVILDPSLHRYIEATEETETFIQAVYNVLMKDKKLCGKNLKFYCRKPKSGDLQYMARYDGTGSHSTGGESYSHIIELANGKRYYLTDERFELL